MEDMFLPDADAQSLREEGNAFFRDGDYQQALEKYSAVLNGWPDSTTILTGGYVHVVPALLNRAACALELGDRVAGHGRDRQQLYANAIRDSTQAMEFGLGPGGAVAKESAKALYRWGRGRVSQATCQLDELDESASQPEMRNGFQSVVTKDLRLAMQDLGAALDQNKQLRLGCRQAREQLRLAEAQFLRVGEEPYLVVAEDAAQVVNVDAHGEGVIFEAGATWMENQVSLEVPVRGSSGQVTELPVNLHKQLNTNNFGELAIFMFCSDNLGEDYGSAMKGELFANLSDAIPSDCCGKEDLQCADEFVMSLNLARTQAGTVQALVDKGLIVRKRVIATTGFGEDFVVYSANF